MKIETGYVPTLLGRVTEMHASYYAREYGFGAVFERKVASEMAEFLGRIDKQSNQVFWVRKADRILGSVSIDGEDLDNKDAHLRWFILDDDARGLGLGKMLMSAAMDFVDINGFKNTKLWTFRGLSAARHLYENFGFELQEEKAGTQWGTEVFEQEFSRKQRSRHRQ